MRRIYIHSPCDDEYPNEYPIFVSDIILRSMTHVIHVQMTLYVAIIKMCTCVAEIEIWMTNDNMHTMHELILPRKHGV